METSERDATLRVEETVTIARPVHDVFAFVGDPANDSAWRSDVLASTHQSQEPLGPGTTFRWVSKAPLGKGREMEGKVDEYDPPHRVRLLCLGAGAPVVTYTLEPGRGGTRLTRAVDVQCGPRFMAPLIREVVKRRNAAYVAKLKEVLESAR